MKPLSLKLGCIPRAPILLYDIPIVDDFSNPRKARPIRSRRVEEANVDVTIVLKLLEFGRGVVRDEDEIDLGVRVRCMAVGIVSRWNIGWGLTSSWCHGSRMKMAIRRARRQHTRLCILDDLVQICQEMRL